MEAGSVSILTCFKFCRGARVDYVDNGSLDLRTEDYVVNQDCYSHGEA